MQKVGKNGMMVRDGERKGCGIQTMCGGGRDMPERDKLRWTRSGYARDSARPDSRAAAGVKGELRLRLLLLLLCKMGRNATAAAASGAALRAGGGPSDESSSARVSPTRYEGGGVLSATTVVVVVAATVAAVPAREAARSPWRKACLYERWRRSKRTI